MRAQVVIALAFAVALAAAGCAESADGAEPGTCSVALAFTPAMPVATPGAKVRVNALVSGVGGVLDYAWTVHRGGAAVDFEEALANGSAIEFLAEDPDVYDVTLDVWAPTGSCPRAREEIAVLDPNGNLLEVRLHVVPPADAGAPPTTRRLRLVGGTDYPVGPVVLDPGVLVTRSVQSGGTGVPAYLRFSPAGMDEASVEAFSAATGAFTVRVHDTTHEVLVIPSDPGLAPRRVTWSPSQPTISVDAGTEITGAVHHGTSPIAGAKVQLMLDGVPSTVGTTGADGAFVVRGTYAAGAPVKVVVTPPAGSGLPRLEADGALDVARPIAIAYASAIALRDVGGTAIRRGPSALPGARVTLVGELASIGTVTAGVTATARGHVRIPLTADAGGVLPAALAPAGPLEAVIVAGAADVAVSAFDLGPSVPSMLDAPAMLTQTTTVLGSEPLAGVRLSLIPTGALAAAGIPASDVVSDETGALRAKLAAGGTYDLVWTDPAGRVGQHIAREVASLDASYVLPPALRITGTLSVTGNPNRIQGAAVTILCDACTGLDRERPIAEGASDHLGVFSLAVPDPGTM